MTLSQGKSIPALGQAWSRGLKPSLHGTLPEVLPFMLSRGGRSVHMRIDYDQIDHLYDENPLRKKRVDPHLERYLALLDDHSRVPIRAVDIACGTGNQAIANKARFPDVEIWGVDRSAEMLAQARRKSHEIRWVQVDMDQGNLRLEGSHYASCQFAYHHSRAKRHFMQNAYRSVYPGGWFTISNLDVFEMEDWYLYQFFPAARELDWKDFLTREDLQEVLQGVGFRVLSCETHQHTQRKTIAERCKACEFRQSTSELLAIDDAAYEKGMADLRDRAQLAGGDVVESLVAVVEIVLEKPQQ